MRTTRTALTAFLILLFAEACLANGPIERLDRWFVFGTNLAWFKGDYGSDLGNQVEGRWKTHFTPENCEKVFGNLEKMGCPVVRVWAFEAQEGLTFTADLTNDPKYPYHEVTGLDPLFLANCRILMDTAARHHVKVYWSLLNHLIREDQGGRHMRIINDPKVRASYISNAAVPFLNEFARHPAFFAVDCINEAEGAVGGLDALTGCMNPTIGTSWKNMRAFIKACATAFHAAVPGIKVTSTSGWHEAKSLKAGRFTGLGLDFYDWHSYRDDPVLPNARSLGLDKPVILGECGPKTEKPDSGFALQGKNWKKYLKEAQGKGYAGLLTWSYGNPGQDNNFVMVNADHSWRPGARMIFASTRGSVIPDAGPLMLTDEELLIRNAVNAAVKPVIAAGRDGALAAQGSPLAAHIGWIARETWKYYPYLNERYSLISLQRAAEEVTCLGNWELRSKTRSQARLDSLTRIANLMLTAVSKRKGLTSLSAIKRLALFVKASTSGSPLPPPSPFDEDFTVVSPTR